MKTAVLNMNKLDYPVAPYPNAASAREILHKIVDHLLMIASCAGIAAVILLAVALA